MKKQLQAWIATAHYLLGRKATALPNGVQIKSFGGKSRIVPYSKIQRCIVRPKHESIRIFSERSDIRFHSVILIGGTSYAMKMSKDKADSFIRHLKKYAPEVVISTAAERIYSIQIPQK